MTDPDGAPDPGAAPRQLSRRTVLQVSGGLGLAGLVPVAALATASTPYKLPVNLSGLVAGTTGQVVLATASAYRTPHATVSAWARQQDGTWALKLGPYVSWIGPYGFARQGTKREGDLHSPTGVFGLPLAFGTKARPTGLKMAYHKLTPYDIWVENPRSKYYNELVDVRRVGWKAIGDHENAVTYPIGAFIAYNSRRVRGLGSAIFLHPSHNSPTIGCVSIPQAQLVTLLKWVNPAANPVIAMGVTSELLAIGGPIPVPTPTPSPTDTVSPTPTDSATPTDSPTPAPTATTLLPLSSH